MKRDTERGTFETGNTSYCGDVHLKEKTINSVLIQYVKIWIFSKIHK